MSEFFCGHDTTDKDERRERRRLVVQIAAGIHASIVNNSEDPHMEGIADLALDQLRAIEEALEKEPPR